MNKYDFNYLVNELLKERVKTLKCVINITLSNVGEYKIQYVR